MYNKQFLLGHLVDKPALRYTGSGKAVCSFRVASNSSRRGASGGPHTQYHNIVAWQKLGEACAKLLSKGSPVFLEGEVRDREWETRNGDKRTTTECHAQQVQFLQRGVPQGLLPTIEKAAKGEELAKEEQESLLRFVNQRTRSKSDDDEEAPPPIDDAEAPEAAKADDDDNEDDTSEDGDGPPW